MTHKIEFSEELIKELKGRLSSEKDSKIYRRLLWLDLKYRGYGQKEISAILQISQAQLTNWSKIFVEEGLKGLCMTHYEDRRPSKLTPYLEKIRDHIQRDCVSTLSCLQVWLSEECGLFVEQSWLSRWIKKNSIVLTKRLD